MLRGLDAFDPFLTVVAINKEGFIEIIDKSVIGRIVSILHNPGTEYLELS
ncbi:hypothetical protein [Pyrodictium abyssi]|uniref:Uncharacterized protein n=1 Tax=Pyrodictium abyssi TaxID=54256 RepID=A0ABN6ZSG1_9CREN|nr:hypothetical protein PABY_11020 [Pyrodictium abyssi]